ncbi:hypothetical protein RND81_14G181500 [Saponaria officinalis]|uniref:VQ domain-containing protein n=1 Tax=Saponaria officinalis TaxID=3572 RepID=A0AAW1GU42_SAPOF
MSSNNNYNSDYNNLDSRNPSATYVTYDTSLENNTTFVQTHPSDFRAVVQRLTGSTTAIASFSGPNFENTMSFKLHERRKLEMTKLNNNNNYHYDHGPTNGLFRPTGGNNEMISPVSTLDGLGLGLGSPSPRNINEEKERAIIAEKGFYLHPISPMNTNSRDYCNEPKLLPLFPLHSPRD